MQAEATAPKAATNATDKLPLMLNIRQLSEVANVSIPTLERMKAMGSLPQHVVIGKGNHRWSRDEVLAWLAAGAPPQAEWRARRKLAK